jgi:dTDP-4-amino-4,6-dideoxygalactose transaminase
LKIPNKPYLELSFRNYYYSYSSAREALYKLILLNIDEYSQIFIPAYIGLSPREGSGIFDPIKKSKIKYYFYRLDKNLNIDFNNLANQILENPKSLILLVHYWGFLDPNHEKIRLLAADNNCLIIDDFAHALFTFFKYPFINFNFGILSLHKMFHYSEGGVLISKNPIFNLNKYDLSFFEYNITEIIEKRISNYYIILKELKKIDNPNILILRDNLKNNVPQSFPILIKNHNLKEFLYIELNKAGFGVLSLYYQLITEIDYSYINERDISSRILNLPLHQDVNSDLLIEMISHIDILCKIFEIND